jgi:hypothetical protein
MYHSYNNAADKSRGKKVLFDMGASARSVSGNCLISSFSRCISGLAEVGAGAIAMGLGGYLAALPIAVVQRSEKK